MARYWKTSQNDFVLHSTSFMQFSDKTTASKDFNNTYAQIVLVFC